MCVYFAFGYFLLIRDLHREEAEKRGDKDVSAAQTAENTASPDAAAVVESVSTGDN